MRHAGADGVKVDFQMTLEEIAHDTTDRVWINRSTMKPWKGQPQTISPAS